ncbi:hypothetical protein LINPERPRIM_LOCUS39550 [Linum perenne]
MSPSSMSIGKQTSLPITLLAWGMIELWESTLLTLQTVGSCIRLAMIFRWHRSSFGDFELSVFRFFYQKKGMRQNALLSSSFCY